MERWLSGRKRRTRNAVYSKEYREFESHSLRMLKQELSKIRDTLTCAAAVIVRDGKILLGMRNYTPDKWKAISVWTMPGGRCDLGETVEETLRREVQEEIGITDLEIRYYIGEVLGAKEGDVVPLFLCQTDQEPQLMEPEKFSEWKWVPIEEYIKGAPYDVINAEAHRIISEFLTQECMF